MKKEAQNRLEKINELQKIIASKQAELERLLLPESNNIIQTPPGFSVTEEVMKVIFEAGQEGIARQEILQQLTKNFPTYGIDIKQVASALAYLNNTKKTIEIIRRGIYRAKSIFEIHVIN